VAIKEIMRRTDKSRGLVRQVVRGARADMFSSRMSSLDPFLTRLETALADGCRNGAALWRAMKVRGFAGGLRVVTVWATRKRKEEGTETRDKRPGKAPSARRIAQMMTTDRDKVSKTARTVAIIGDAAPDLTAARDLLGRFHRIIQHRKEERLDQWIEEAKPGLMKSFASGIVQEHAAVKAALTEPWSNGQTEGHNTKLKLVKRQMYGWASPDLLKARLLAVV
jgi:transposase